MDITIRYNGEVRTLSNVEETSRKYPDQEGSVPTSILVVEYLHPQMEDAEYEGAIIEGMELTDDEIDGQTAELVS